MRARLAAGEVVRVHLALEVGCRRGTSAGFAALKPEEPGLNGVAHLESTISALGENAYLVQVHDITTEVQSKAALRERETFFRSVFQAIPYPTVVWKHVRRE